MFKKISISILIVIISVVLTVYFVFSLYVFPQIYLSTTESSKRALPLITNVTTSYIENLSLGESFNITVTSVNLGDAADIQITSLSFPNLTKSIDNERDQTIEILHHNFTQSPSFMAMGDEVGSQYAGLSRTTITKYPSIEFYSRPWHSKTFYETQLEVTPPFTGNFVIFVKTVALPHVDNTSHYPTTGIRDQQQEFVTAYHFNII
jgi:hypothetical protein